MIMERTKRRHSFLVILSTVVAFALLSTDIFLPALIDPFLAASDTMNGRRIFPSFYAAIKISSKS